MNLFVDITLLTAYIIMAIVHARTSRRLGDLERDKSRFEAGYEHMVRINRERSDALNALNAELQRKNEYIALLEKERDAVRYSISSFGSNMKRLGWPLSL